MIDVGKKDYGEKGQIVRAKLEEKTGKVDLKQVKYVIEGVDEEGYVTGDLPKREEGDQIQHKLDEIEERKEKDTQRKN